MFDNAFAILKGLFSRSFVVSAFLPVFFAVVFNTCFAALATKGLTGALSYITASLEIADVATALGLVTLIAIPLAFALSPLLVSFRLLLEGESWPEPIRRQFIAATKRRGDGVGARARIARDYAEKYKIILDEAEKNLPEAARKGDSAGAITQPELIEEAETAIKTFKDTFEVLMEAQPQDYEGQTATALDVFRGAFKTLREALEANASTLPTSNSTKDIALARRLSKAFDSFFEAIEDGRKNARFEASRCIAKRDALFVANDPRPTRLGNLRAQIEEYCQSVYGVDLDYLWPRLRFGIDHDEDKFEPLEQAETQLNFALMMLLLVMVSSFGWLSHLLCTSADPVLLATIGLLVPILNFAFYLVVVASQRLLVATMKAVIDRFRLALLAALNLPPPKDYAEERAAWQKLEEMSQGLRIGQPLDYVVPKS